MNRKYKSLWLHMRKRAAKGKKDQDFLHRRHSNFFVLHCFATICENYLICFTFWSIEVGRGTTKCQFLLCDGWMIMTVLTGLLCQVILRPLFFPTFFSHRGNHYVNLTSFSDSPACFSLSYWGDLQNKLFIGPTCLLNLITLWLLWPKLRDLGRTGHFPSPPAVLVILF